MTGRLLLDATKTFESRFTTGIQRVVRELVRRSDLIGRDLDMEVVPVVASAHGYHRLDAAGLERLLTIPATGGSGVVAQSRLARRAKRVLQTSMRLYAFLQHRSMTRRMAQLTAGLDRVEVAPGDVVASIDEFSGGSPSIAALEMARRHGATTVAIVYDLIAILHRDMVPRPIAYLFKRGFERIVPAADGLIAISRSGAELIRQQPSVRAADVTVTSFYLGQDPHVACGDAGTSSIPEVAWQGGPTFVMIGTIEPRKRHAAVLEAFNRLWQEGHAANLLMIGRIGWEVDDLVRRIHAHPEYGRSLFLCHQVGDGELRRATERADAAIMASRAEGFGLPIVEALGLGTPVLATDIPVFREIAGDAGCYFPADDPAEFVDVLKRFTAQPGPYREAARAFRWIDWDGSAHEFATAVRTILERSGT